MYTNRSDLVIPEILAETVTGKLAGKKALYGSSAVIMKDTLPGDSRGGDKVKVPFFEHIGEAQFLDEGIPLDVAKISQTSEEAVVIRAGKSFEVTDWARMAGSSDAYEEAGTQIADVIQRAWDFKLIEKASATTLVRNIYNAGAPKRLNLDEMIKAKLLWADEQDMIALGVVHSMTDADIRLQKDSTGKHLYTDPVNDGQLARYGGVPLTISDRLTPTTDAPPKYKSLICKQGSLVLWHNPSLMIETGRDILTGTEVVAVNTYFIAHMYKRKPGSTKAGVVKIIHNAGE
jgi:hypothetical protein